MITTEEINQIQAKLSADHGAELVSICNTLSMASSALALVYGPMHSTSASMALAQMTAFFAHSKGHDSPSIIRCMKDCQKASETIGQLMHAEQPIDPLTANALNEIIEKALKR